MSARWLPKSDGALSIVGAHLRQSEAEPIKDRACLRGPEELDINREAGWKHRSCHDGALFERRISMIRNSIQRPFELRAGTRTIERQRFRRQHCRSPRSVPFARCFHQKSTFLARRPTRRNRPEPPLRRDHKEHARDSRWRPFELPGPQAIEYPRKYPRRRSPSRRRDVQWRIVRDSGYAKPVLISSRG